MRASYLHLQRNVLFLAAVILLAVAGISHATPLPLNAECGPVGEFVISRAKLIATQGYSLCFEGTPANFNSSSTTGPWTWQCLGNNGGESRSCSTSLSPAPACGGAHGSGFSTAPSSDLCSGGQPLLVTGRGPWGWICGNVFSGTSVLCGAASTAPTPAARSWDFTNSIGVNAHLGSTNTHYGNLGQTIADLHFLQSIHGSSHIGFNHMRTSVMSYHFAKLLAKSNITALVSPTQAGLQDPAANQAMFDQFAYVIEGIEGVNEPDHIFTTPNGLFSSGFVYNNQTGVLAAVVYQRDLYNFLKSDPVTSTIPVYNFSLGYLNDADISGDMSAYADIANIHAYAGKGSSPYLSIIPHVAQQVNMPGKPAVISEIGYPSIPPGESINLKSPNYNKLMNEVSEDVQAKYTLSELFDSFIAGYTKIFVYELYDDGGPEPNSCDVANTNKEFHFGLFRCDWSPKPLAMALKNLVSILADPSVEAATFTPQSLAFTLTQTSSDPNQNVNVFNTLLQNSAGTYFLALWAEPVLWNVTTAQQIPVAGPNIVTVTLNEAKNFKVYDPMVGPAPISQLLGATQVVVDVYDHPIIIALN